MTRARNPQAIRAGRFWARVTPKGYRIYDDTRGLVRTVECGGSLSNRKRAASGEVAQLYHELEQQIRAVLVSLDGGAP